MTLDLTEIETRAAAAELGPWVTRRSGTEVWSATGDEIATMSEDVFNNADANATFIAHARTDVPALVARVLELEAELDALR